VEALNNPAKRDLDKEILRIFMKSIELLGGPRKLIKYRNLSWLPSLMEACYAIALKNRFKTEDEIAKELGTTREAVNMMLESDPLLVREKVVGEYIGNLDEHMAGGIAKLAWNEIKKGREDVEFMIGASRRVLEELGGPVWAILTLIRVKDLSFPLLARQSDVLKERLKGVRAFGMDIGELASVISYPIENPAELLGKLSKEIRKHMKEE